MKKKGWSWLPMSKTIYLVTILLIIISYSIITVVLLSQPELPNPIWSNLQLVLSIVYFISGIFAFVNFLAKKHRIIYAILSLFCILPSLHLYATSGLINSIGSARYWYIYFANISYYAIFCLFANYLVDRFKSIDKKTPLDSFFTALEVALGLTLANYFNFFADVHYLDSFQYTEFSYYQPLFKANLRIALAIFIILLVAVYWLYGVLVRSKIKRLDKVYLIIWIYAFILSCAQIFDLYIGFRGLQLKANFSIIMATYIAVNLYLLIFLGYYAINSLLPIKEFRRKIWSISMDGLKQKEKSFSHQLAQLTLDENFRNLANLFLLIAIVILLVISKFSNQAFLFQTIAFFIGVLLFLYAILYPFIVDLGRGRKNTKA